MKEVSTDTDFSVDVHHNYYQDEKMNEYWIVETNPFSVKTHRVLLELNQVGVDTIKNSNPDLNLRPATEEELKDQSIDRPQMNWELIAERELEALRGQYDGQYEMSSHEREVQAL